MEIEINRDEMGRILPGQPPLNPNGRPPMTMEQKLIKKAAKDIIADYKQALAEALPMIQPVLIAKAIDGDISAIKEVHDRAMDKAKQPTDVTTDGKELPVPILNVQFNNRHEENIGTTEEN